MCIYFIDICTCYDGACLAAHLSSKNLRSEIRVPVYRLQTDQERPSDFRDSGRGFRKRPCATSAGRDDLPRMHRVHGEMSWRRAQGNSTQASKTWRTWRSWRLNLQPCSCVLLRLKPAPSALICAICGQPTRQAGSLHHVNKPPNGLAAPTLRAQNHHAPAGSYGCSVEAPAATARRPPVEFGRVWCRIWNRDITSSPTFTAEAQSSQSHATSAYGL